jgi:hypothetical protein
MKTYCLRPLLIVLCMAAVVAYSQSDASRVFTGHKLDDKAAAKESDAVIIAKVKALPVRQSLSAGMSFYEGAPAEVIGGLKGNLPGEVGATFKVINEEAAPKVGDPYIMFLKKLDTPGEYSCLKILPATKENIAAIKAVIGSQ